MNKTNTPTTKRRVRTSRRSETLKELNKIFKEESGVSAGNEIDAISFKRGWKPENIEIDLVTDWGDGTKHIVAHNKRSGSYTEVIWNENSAAVS